MPEPAVWRDVMVHVAVRLVAAVTRPMRSAYINGVIPSTQRATVLSFDSLMGSAGGVVAQPALGRMADVNGHAAPYLVSAGIEVVALPFVLLARREQAASHPITADLEPEAPPTAASATRSLPLKHARDWGYASDG